MADSLSGKKVLLTGASRGIGYASAKLLIQAGADVLGVGQTPDLLRKAEQDFARVGPGTFRSLCLNVAGDDAADILRQQVENRFESLDVAIFNAAVMLPLDDTIMKIPEAVLLQTMNVNVLAPFRSARTLLPLLLAAPRPRIINVGSGAGTIALLSDEGIAAYRLSKWTLHGLTMLQAKELTGQVCVNAFDPGWIKTDLGGPRAPGTPQEAAEGLLATLSLPWEKSGGFYKDGREIPW